MAEAAAQAGDHLTWWTFSLGCDACVMTGGSFAGSEAGTCCRSGMRPLSRHNSHFICISITLFTNLLVAFWLF